MPEARTWPIQIISTQDVSCGARAWSTGSRKRVTALIKATFFLVRGAPMRLVNPAPVLLNDQHHENSVDRSILAPNDFSPYLPRAEVIFTGHAYAPTPSPFVPVRLSVIGVRPLIDKTLHVFGERMWLDDVQMTAPVPFTRVPIRYERAFRGPPGYEDNPIGMPKGPGLPVHNVTDPHDMDAPAGLGAIAAYWPPRRRLLRNLEPTAVQAIAPELPDTFAWSFFHASPPDQRCSFFEGNEWIVLEGLHPEHPRFESQLPSCRARARLYGPEVAPYREIGLAADMMWIDGDRSLCCLVWRGNFEVESETMLETSQLFAGLEMPGRSIPWPAPSVALPSKSIPPPSEADSTLQSPRRMPSGSQPQIQVPVAPQRTPSGLFAVPQNFGASQAGPSHQPSSPPPQVLPATPAQRPSQILPIPQQPAQPQPAAQPSMLAGLASENTSQPAAPAPAPAAAQPVATPAPSPALREMPSQPLQEKLLGTLPSPTLSPFAGAAAPNTNATPGTSGLRAGTMASLPDLNPTPSRSQPVIQIENSNWNDDDSVANQAKTAVHSAETAAAVAAMVAAEPPLSMNATLTQPPSELQRLIERTRAEARGLTPPAGAAPVANAPPPAPRAEAPSTPPVQQHEFEDSPTVAPDTGDIQRILAQAEENAKAEDEAAKRGSRPTPAAVLRNQKTTIRGLGGANKIVEPPPTARQLSPMQGEDAPTAQLQVPDVLLKLAAASAELGTPASSASKAPDTAPTGAPPPPPPAASASAGEDEFGDAFDRSFSDAPDAPTEAPTSPPAPATTPPGGEIFDPASQDVMSLESQEPPAMSSPAVANLEQAFANAAEPSVTEAPAELLSVPAIEEDDQGRPTLSEMEAPPVSSAGSPPPPVHQGETRMEIERRIREGDSLEGLDMSDLDLSGFDFSGKRLNGSKLVRTNLRRARLRGCNLTGTTLEGADLVEADLDDAQLERANLTGAKLSGATLRRAYLTDVNLANADARRASFEQATGQRAVFSRARLDSATFAGVQLDSADLTEAQVDGANFDGALLPELKAYELSADDTSFLRCALVNARFDGGVLSRARFDGAVAEDSMWDRAVLDGASFDGARLTGASFTKASLRRANLSHAELSEARFNRANLSAARLVGVNLSLLTLDGADLSGIVTTE
ncbi:MAG: DUF2169 domain-containing protein [Polyangiaceae bacterium]